MALEDILLFHRGELTSASRRALARSFFTAFYERGYSANRALATLRQAGLGYRRADFLRDYREGLATFERFKRVRFVREDRVPTERILEERFFGVPDRYSFKFRVEIYNAETGEVRHKYFFLHANRLAARGQLEADALRRYLDRYEIGATEVVRRIQLWEGYVNPVWAGA